MGRPDVDLNCGVYLGTHRLNGMQYVGKAGDLRDRFYRHRAGRRWNLAMQAEGRAHGVDVFSWVVIDWCDPGLLLQREQHWIDRLGTRWPSGYNRRGAVPGNLGYSHTKDSRRRMSVARKGRERSEAEQAATARMIAASHTPAVRKKAAAAISVSMRGNNNGVHQGPDSPERAAKRSEVMAARWADPDYRERMLQVCAAGGKVPGKATGKTRSAQARQNMRDGWARRRARLQEAKASPITGGQGEPASRP